MLLSFRRKAAHVGVLTDGRSWEFYVVEHVHVTAEDIGEQSENADEMFEESLSADLDEGFPGVINLY
jgi:hypothetical protein